MRETIMPNDIIKHKPTGETWVVAGVNHQTRELVPMGYHFPSVAKVEDCEIIERRYEFESQSEEVIKALKKAGMTNFIDFRSAMWHGLLRYAEDGERKGGDE